MYAVFACVYTVMPRAVLMKEKDNEFQQRIISASDPSLFGNQQTITEESDSASVQTAAEAEGEELKVGCLVTSM